jgi:hypothetical protein
MNAESVKARLKNFAVSSGCTFQDALVYYGLERTIYRLSVSPYASHFVLKGGIFLYAIFDRKYERATTDVDLLARRISNSAEEMKDVFRNILPRTPMTLLFSTLLPLQRKISPNSKNIMDCISQRSHILTGPEFQSGLISDSVM